MTLGVIVGSEVFDDVGGGICGIAARKLLGDTEVSHLRPTRGGRESKSNESIRWRSSGNYPRRRQK
ncbi:hypothetical protein WG66_004954 [Moniliophthora roreri]|nr:hypothetical protein WG66_004954 [Moniliophthora roreri]